MEKKTKPFSRRDLLQLALASGLVSVVGGGVGSRVRAADAAMQTVDPKDRKLLF
ncbi:MAG: hypothetical protein JWN04_350, partial [Myxococcaceae bacterium]|nr:hypothetical protein [Myxococcaceae bacterium]